MQLSPEQVASYQEDGFLLVEDCFSAAEVELMKREMEVELRDGGERRVLEKSGQVVRSVYGSHDHSEVFRSLARHPRLVEPSRRILGDDVYVYQFKINAKAAFGGDLWEWHQDYVFWLAEDGLPEPELTSAVVFLDEVNEFNGPLILISGSHRRGVIEVEPDAGVPPEYGESPAWISNLTADLKYSITPAMLRTMVSDGPMVAPKGPAGSVLFFHPNVVHGSGPNMSPFDRALAIVTYCKVGNVPQPVGERRPEFLVSADHAPIRAVQDDALSSVGPREPVRHGSAI